MELRNVLAEARLRLGSARHARKIHREAQDKRILYLNLIERCLLGVVHNEEEPGTTGRNKRVEERGRAPLAHTMIGPERLANVRELCESVIAEEVEGDFIEAGVWRGGATIMMRAVIEAYGQQRRVWVADSFEGLPPPDEKYTLDKGDTHYLNDELAVSVEEVKDNFRRYGLLDSRVEFLKGYFNTTLPSAPIEKLAVARLDGDMYAAAFESLENLYPKLSIGGYLIVDDYSNLEATRQAVDDYRREHGITEKIEEIDWTGVYWRRTA